MPTYKGYKASILDGLTSLPLPEYETTVSSNPDFVTCYIESSADQFFNIVLEDMTAGISQGTAVYVDGIYIDNGLTAPGVAVERRWYGKRIDHESVRPFIFRNIISGKRYPRPTNYCIFNVNFSDNLIATNNSGVGTISLVMRRCRIEGKAEDQTNRGCVPRDIEPPPVRNSDPQHQDYLAHRAEYVIQATLSSDVFL